MAANSLGVSLPRLRLLIVLGTGLCCRGIGGSDGRSGLCRADRPAFHPQHGRRAARARFCCHPRWRGAILTLVADQLVRLAPGPGEMRLGIAMAALGAPFFFFLLARIRGQEA